MRSKTHTRIWTPGRIVALIAVAVVIAGLAHTRFSHPAGWAAVPSGAHAGQLSLKPCHYSTEAGSLPADCGTLVVPENRADPHSRLIAVPVTRIRSRASHPGAPIFRLEGGPGRSNLDFPFASRYIAHHDLVLVGYRGVDGSARLDCPEVNSARRHSADLVSASSVRASATALRSCAQRLRSSGYDLAGYTLSERVDDLDAARTAMGYGRVDLLSESFGTRVALVYAWRHPQSIERSVMVGVNPPGHFVWRPAQTDAQLARLGQLTTMRHTAAGFPSHWGPLPIHRGNAELAAFFGLMDASSDAAPISAPMTVDAWRAAGQGDASGVWFESLAASLLLPRAQVWGDSAAMTRVDAAAAARHFASHQPGSVLGDPGTQYLWTGGGSVHAWPSSPDENTYSRMRDSDVPTLLIGGTVDGATPAENATHDLLPHLPNGHQVLLQGFGHTTDFWNQQVPAGSHLINQYLDTGQVDASRYVPQKIDFTPGLTQTALAKKVVGAMIALALFTLLSLVWIARRVRRRGRLGRVTRVLARTVWVALLGLGGWFGAVLFALIVLPSVPIDAMLLIVLGMGVPVALASYWAWRGPDRAASRRVGVSVALAGALVGGWIGLACGTAMLAILTTLLGVIAGTNLALIACDIVSETRRRRRAAPAAQEPVREAVLA